MTAENEQKHLCRKLQRCYFFFQKISGKNMKTEFFWEKESVCFRHIEMGICED